MDCAEWIVPHWAMPSLEYICNRENRLAAGISVDNKRIFAGTTCMYLIYAIRLLIAQNGGVSLQLANQMRWNRTVKCVLEEERNIEMDLKNEFSNGSYKN